MAAVPLIELWRGGMLESVHSGHAVIFGPGGIEAAWGDPATVIFPRSSCKMIQALPLLESGAAAAVGLTDRQLALACASHNGSALHTLAVADWLGGLGIIEGDLRCGVQWPSDMPARNDLVKADMAPCQFHNNCSGKHSGFLTLSRHLKAGAEYTETDHPLQRAILEATEDVCRETSAGFGIDGCSAPNFAITLAGFARAMAFFAAANPEGDLRNQAAARLTRAMATHPEMVAGEGECDTLLMRAMGHRVATKGGADGVYVAILPDQKRGVALKVMDGAERGKTAAIVALLIRLGVLAAGSDVAARYLTGPLRNWRGKVVGETRLAEGFA